MAIIYASNNGPIVFPFSPSTGGGGGGGGGSGSTGIRVQKDGITLGTSITTLNLTGTNATVSVSGSTAIAAFAGTTAPAFTSSSFGVHRFTAVNGQTNFILPFDVTSIVSLTVGMDSVAFTFTSPRTIIFNPTITGFTLQAGDLVTAHYFQAPV